MSVILKNWTCLCKWKYFSLKIGDDSLKKILLNKL